MGADELLDLRPVRSGDSTSRDCSGWTGEAKQPFDGCTPTPATPSARVLAGICTTLNPSMIVVGGSLGTSPTLVKAIRDGVDRYAHPEAAASVAVVPGHFGGRAEIMGSLALAISRAADLA